MGKQRWSPIKATIVTVVLVFVLGIVGAGVFAAADGDMSHDPEKAGEKVGRALGPAMVIAGIIAYFVQKSRKSDDT